MGLCLFSSMPVILYASWSHGHLGSMFWICNVWGHLRHWIIPIISKQAHCILCLYCLVKCTYIMCINVQLVRWWQSCEEWGGSHTASTCCEAVINSALWQPSLSQPADQSVLIDRGRILEIVDQSVLIGEEGDRATWGWDGLVEECTPSTLCRTCWRSGKGGRRRRRRRLLPQITCQLLFLFSTHREADQGTQAMWRFSLRQMYQRIYEVWVRVVM